MDDYKIIINNQLVSDFNVRYKKVHFRSKKPAIKGPIPPSLNEWINMNPLQRNDLKQKWKEFVVFLVNHYELSDLMIPKCKIDIMYTFGTRHRHDADNYTPKFIFDGLTEAKVLADDDFGHVTSVTIGTFGYEQNNAKTEIIFHLL